MKRRPSRGEYALLLTPLAVFTAFALRSQFQAGYYKLTPRSFDVGNAPIVEFRFSPDGSKMVSRSGISQGPGHLKIEKAAFLRLWDVSSCQLLWEIPSPTNSNSLPTFSPDGATLVGTQESTDPSSGKPSTNICVWNAASGELTRSIPSRGSNSASFTPDGRSIVAGSRGQAGAVLNFWNSATGQLLSSTPCEGIQFVSRDKSLMVLRKLWISKQKKVLAQAQIVDTKTGQIRSKFPKKPWTIDKGPAQIPEFFEIAPRNKFLACNSLSIATQIWNIKSGTLASQPSSKYAFRLRFSPDGSKLVTVDWHGQYIEKNPRKSGSTVKLFDAASGRLIWQEDWNQPGSEISFSQDGKLIAVRGSSSLKLFDAQHGNAVKEYPLDDKHDFNFTPDSRHIALAEGQYVRIYPINNGSRD